MYHHCLQIDSPGNSQKADWSRKLEVKVVDRHLFDNNCYNLCLVAKQRVIVGQSPSLNRPV